MEWLQKILSNAVYDKDGKSDIEATIKKVNEEAPKHVVPKEQYNSKVKELETANTTIGELKKSNGDNEELQKTIKTHETTIKELKAAHDLEMKGMKIDSAINKLLADNKAKYPELLAGKFDTKKLQLSDDGQIIGLNEQFKSIKESYKDMFSSVVSGKPPANPDNKPNGSTTFETLVNNADTMTAEEVAAQFAVMDKQ